MKAAASNNGKDVEYTVELFARTKGEVVRYGGRGRGKQLGERKIDMTGLVPGSNSTMEERENDEDTELCVELMREGLYMHCNAHKAIRDLYAVSRGKDKSSIVLIGEKFERRCVKEKGGEQE